MLRFPVISVVITVICLGALIVGFINSIKAASKTLTMLTIQFKFQAFEYAPVERYRNAYMLVTCWTVCGALAALAYDFVLTNSNRPYRPTWVSLTLFGALFGTFFLWLYVLHMAIFIHFIYAMENKICTGWTALVKGHCYWSGIDWWFGNESPITPICYDNWVKFCFQFIVPTAPHYTNVVLCAIVVACSLIYYMVCFAPIYKYLNRPNASKSFGSRRNRSTSRSLQLSRSSAR